MTSSPLLSIRDSSFGYFSGMIFTPVISNISFELASGQFVVLDGSNGCGKSTIIRALLKMGAHFKGDVSLNIPRAEIGYVPQDAAVELSAPITAIDVIKSTFPFGGVSMRTIKYVLNRVGLETKGHNRYGALSGGQRRRVLLARALVSDPRLIILDEPTANIDQATKMVLEELLVELTNSEDKAVLATSHAPHWAKEARRIQLEENVKK
ncbi:ATP-binding cassette domain-containing protein [Chitinispirillales bacterium ANBcel5]|uniref:metal ABC transporter ATP-binding protein n=1 Tax=Cellulosispirillum alkaliphilum TaxID=3039283 RepID=UPI002A52E536|nr:ATP-binding cassette domain-containing protein [Chitinispirillales bacterium ANBcel5]